MNPMNTGSTSERVAEILNDINSLPIKFKQVVDDFCHEYCDTLNLKKKDFSILTHKSLKELSADISRGFASEVELSKIFSIEILDHTGEVVTTLKKASLVDICDFKKLNLRMNAEDYWQIRNDLTGELITVDDSVKFIDTLKEELYKNVT